MNQPTPRSVNTHAPDPTGRLTMLTSHTPLRLISCSLLLLLLTSGSTSKESWSPTAGTDSQKVLILDAVKTGILRSLGLDREPWPTPKASQQELKKMLQLYREQISEMKRNASRQVRMARQTSTTAVLFPVKPVLWRVYPRPGHRITWYRAIFQKNPNIQRDMTLSQAQLKLSTHVLDENNTNSEVSQKIKVKINGIKPVTSALGTNTHSGVQSQASSSQELMLDISPEVKRWMRTDGQPLVVDVGINQLKRDDHKLSPVITLELGLMGAHPAQGARLRRSNKEDVCDEQGLCCRKSLTVSFKDIGWTDWVVAPTEYTMHYCDGACPHNYKPASMHTQVKSRLHQITKGGTPHPCCVPAAYEPMVLMHYDSRGRLKLTPFNDLIVSKCHCA
ncbi:inhibin beta C chain [Nematolebias whitei]|uniref:inhibin beta C chain n=1 Tax=Nematolebias whitei TaxID=451745 RepID=UPI00189B388E|nr:inhibin beta C chain [Nematolebias whitei]